MKNIFILLVLVCGLFLGCSEKERISPKFRNGEIVLLKLNKRECIVVGRAAVSHDYRVKYFDIFGNYTEIIVTEGELEKTEQ